MKKALVYYLYGTKNAGDIAICFGAVELLKQDVRVAEVVLNKLDVNFAQRQFDSLCSFIFNLGAGAFATSTLKKKIVARADDGVVANHCGGQILAVEDKVLQNLDAVDVVRLDS